jgi:hypothetical protein
MNKPNAVSELQTIGWKKYWMSSLFSKCTRLKIKGLYNQNSFKYNFALKLLLHTQTDRSILFDFITSDSFNAIQKTFFEKKARIT